MHIVYVSDGKAGHRSQALGLFQAIQRQCAEQVSFEEISIHDLPIVPLVFAVFKHAIPQLSQQPDFIFGVGSHTQFRVLLLGKIYQNAKTVILMKPNFPFSWFDYAVIPAHDGIAEQGNILVTQGALNPIVNEHRHQKNRILIALGGSSKRHQWNTDKVLTALDGIEQNHPHTQIILTTSRRTPKDFLTQLEQYDFSKNLEIFPVEATPQGWIFEEMQKAEAVWVTEDSVSMIYEALTAGCRVGVIKINRLKQDRITQSVDEIAKIGLVSVYPERDVLAETQVFQEADQVAQRILKSMS